MDIFYVHIQRYSLTYSLTWWLGSLVVGILGHVV